MSDASERLHAPGHGGHDMTANIRAVVEDVVKSMLGNSLATQQKQSADVGSIIRTVLRAQGRFVLVSSQ